MMCISWGSRLLPEDIIEALKKLGRGDIRVVLGGIIPEQDHAALMKHGVKAIFGPGTVISTAAIELLEELLKEDVV